MPMSNRNFPLRIVGVVVLIVAGLGFGYGASRWWRPEPARPAREPAGPDATRQAQGPIGQSRSADPAPAHGGKALNRRALLVGVTKYDHLGPDNHLVGPAN